MAVLATIVALAVFWAAIKTRGALAARAFVEATRAACGDALTAIIAEDFACKARGARVDGAFSCAKLGTTAKIIACVSIAAVGGFLAGITDLAASAGRTRAVFVAAVTAFGASFDRQASGSFALSIVGIAALISGTGHAITDRDTLIFVVALLACGTLARCGSALASEGLGIAFLPRDRAFGVGQTLDAKPGGSAAWSFFGA